MGVAVAVVVTTLRPRVRSQKRKLTSYMQYTLYSKYKDSMTMHNLGICWQVTESLRSEPRWGERVQHGCHGMLHSFSCLSCLLAWCAERIAAHT